MAEVDPSIGVLPSHQPVADAHRGGGPFGSHGLFDLIAAPQLGVEIGLDAAPGGDAVVDVQEQRAHSVLELPRDAMLMMGKHPAGDLGVRHRVVRAGKHHRVHRTAAQHPRAVAALGKARRRRFGDAAAKQPGEADGNRSAGQGGSDPRGPAAVVRALPGCGHGYRDRADQERKLAETGVRQGETPDHRGDDDDLRRPDHGQHSRAGQRRCPGEAGAGACGSPGQLAQELAGAPDGIGGFEHRAAHRGEQQARAGDRETADAQVAIESAPDAVGETAQRRIVESEGCPEAPGGCHGEKDQPHHEQGYPGADQSAASIAGHGDPSADERGTEPERRERACAYLLAEAEQADRRDRPALRLAGGKAHLEIVRHLGG